MLFPFRPYYRDHDFTLIENAIKEYYPIDQAERLTSDTIQAWPGFKKRGALANSEFFDGKAFDKKWGKLVSHLKKNLKRPVIAYPDLTGPSLYGEVLLTENKAPDFLRQQSLCFHISLLGPFFSIYGMDKSTAILPIHSMMEGIQKRHFTTTHVLTTSPIFEYQEVFTALENEIKAYLPTFRFVPYTIGMSTMRNISVEDEMRDFRYMDTIYEGLFGNLSVHECDTRGDEDYGIEDWIRRLDEKEKSMMGLISQHISYASTEITIHKVWKLKESKQLDTFTKSGNLMFGMETFEMIDLTDKLEAILIFRGREAPSCTNYNVRDNIIEINPNYFSLRIVDLTRDSLTLHLTLNIEDQKVLLKGEILEMKFVQAKNEVLDA
jgi:hypothetical protein